MQSILVHIANEEPILGEVDQLPGTTDTIIILKNPRKRDGKDLHYLEPEITTIILPIARASFIEVMTTREEDEIITFVRE
ncbi:MAG TPA: hypothetical protein PLS77_00205 [Anaerolineaceae bacterium]|jgi:hypothetical protein|nr:hypothetical protein [Longilinea sp.]NMD31873.1 hypothetical protein [Chloroflexota bacterium]HNS62908.1 hypothetical protein [Anaerolineaceae bacterium]HNZ00300.1 hypothetical protein [Anaerolineaceae bacterium]HOD45219.1 hypothetical protein [Anaerolineaceae bacterium]